MCELVRAAITLASHASKAAGPPSGQPPAAPAATSAAYEAVWQLHSMLCRAVHAGAGAGTRETLLDTASRTVLVAGKLAAGMGEAAVPLAAMSAAHFELLRTALLHPRAPAIDAARFNSTATFSALSSAVCAGPDAIAAHPDTEAVFSRLAPQVAQASASGFPLRPSLLLRLANPHLPPLKRCTPPQPPTELAYLGAPRERGLPACCCAPAAVWDV